jgi:hypothetical protein
VEPHHLCNAEKGAEFACVQNRNSTDFMNHDKFESYIMKKTQKNDMNGTCWMKLGTEFYNILMRMKINGPQKSGDRMGGIIILQHQMC